MVFEGGGWRGRVVEEFEEDIGREVVEGALVGGWAWYFDFCSWARNEGCRCEGCVSVALLELTKAIVQGF